MINLDRIELAHQRGQIHPNIISFHLQFEILLKKKKHQQFQPTYISNSNYTLGYREDVSNTYMHSSNYTHYCEKVGLIVVTKPF